MVIYCHSFHHNNSLCLWYFDSNSLMLMFLEKLLHFLLFTFKTKKTDLVFVELSNAHSTAHSSKVCKSKTTAHNTQQHNKLYKIISVVLVYHFCYYNIILYYSTKLKYADGLIFYCRN